MSALNANVFFELGIRTAVNKPTCLVVDNKTKKSIPFDLQIINHYEYNAAITMMSGKKDMPSLVKHINDSSKNDGKNALWKYFSLSVKAEPLKTTGSIEDKLEYLTQQVQSLRDSPHSESRPQFFDEQLMAKIANILVGNLEKYGATYESIVFSDDGKKATVFLHRMPTGDVARRLVRTVFGYGVQLIYRLAKTS